MLIVNGVRLMGEWKAKIDVVFSIFPNAENNARTTRKQNSSENKAALI